MGCIEMYQQYRYQYRGQLINRNMGCIEITTATTPTPCLIGLIETWDVLKSDLRNQTISDNTD